MKKFFIVAIAALMATASVKAQHEEGDKTIQPRVGISISSLSNMDGVKSKVNVTYGVEGEYFITDEISVAGGLLFTDEGAKLDDNSTLKLYYTALPVTLNYYVLPGLALKAGVQPAYRLNAKMEVDGVKADLDRFFALYYGEEVKMNKFDLSFPVGLSYEYSGVTLDARYNFGVTKLFSGIDETVTNKMLVVTLGYKF